MTWALAITGFLVSVLIIPGVNRIDMEPRWAALSIMVPLMFAKTDIQWTVAHYLVAATMAYAALSLAWTPIMYDGIGGAWHLLLFAATFFVAYSVDNLRPTYIAMMAGVGLSGFVAVADYTGWLFVPRVAPFAGLFVNPNFLAEAAAPLLVLAVMFRSWLLVPGLLLGAFLPLSRAALLALAVIGCVHLWRVSRVATSALLTVVLSALAWHAAEHANHFSSIMERVDIWRDAWAGMSLIGNGIGSFYVSFPVSASIIDTVFNRPDHAHNELVEAAYELGIPGIVLFGALALLAVGKSAEQSCLGAALLCAMAGFPLHEPCTGFLVAVLAGGIYRHRVCLRDSGALRTASGHLGLYASDERSRASGLPAASGRNISVQFGYAQNAGQHGRAIVRRCAIQLVAAATRIRAALRSALKRFDVASLHSCRAFKRSIHPHPRNSNPERYAT